MELHQLRYFLAIDRTGSFTRAADELGIAQPSLSQQIKRLEKHLGGPLFERLGRSVRLTPAGEALRPLAHAILQQTAEAECRVTALQDGAGPLRVGVIPTIMPYFLARHIASFQRSHPDTTLRVVEDTTARLVQQLQAAEIDLAVVGLPVANEDIVCSELFREELLLAVPAEHPLSAAHRVNLRELKNQRLMLMREGHCLRNDVLTACTRARAELHSVFETDQMESIFELVRSGFGLSVVPAMTAASAYGCRLLPLEARSYRRIGYMRARRHVVTRAMRDFTAWLRAAGKSEAQAADRTSDQPVSVGMV